jgi:tetratricopeptide (TPR) repeat protein
MAVPRLQGLSQTAAQQLVAAAQAIESGGPEMASARLAPVLKAYPNHPEVLRVQAGILNLRGDYQGAVAAMRTAIRGRPDDALYYNTLGSILGSANEYDGAIAALRRACELQPQLAIAWFNLGVMLTRSMRHSAAIDALKRAVALEPRHMAARALLGDMLRTGNRVEEASAEYRRVISEQPWSGMAWWGLANLKTLRLGSDDVEQLRRAMRDARAGDNDRIAMGFALAKALDDQGCYAESLQALSEANAIARRRRQWNAAAFSAEISAILDAFTPPPAGAAHAALGHEVIFIPSLPRSGSTLVEQILASHSKVEGPGELPDLPLTLSEEGRRRGKPFPHWVRELKPADWQRLGERYLERTADLRERRPIFTDKLPGNWYYIGAIRAMLPGAKLIVCRRDPLETCFSCYRQHLDNNEYTRTFDDLAAYWRDYDRAIRHWRALSPGHVYEHVYEDLLADPETSVRALLEFCDLPFEEACVHFHETARDVRTPSAMQVREPLRRDTAHAPRYGAMLDPLRRALGLPTFSP